MWKNLENGKGKMEYLNTKKIHDITKSQETCAYSGLPKPEEYEN